MKLKSNLGLFAALCVALCISLTASAQDASPEGGVAGVHTIRGTITAATPPMFTIRTDEGETWQVKLGPNARVVRGGRFRGEGHGSRADNEQRADNGEKGQRQAPEPIAITDIHVGDMLNAGGEVDQSAKKVNAVFAMVIDAATVKKLEADWGVTYVAGKITAIDSDNAKITVQGPKGKSATIQADENTSFRKGHENITLADIKAGDTITARGAQKNGTFTPTTLVVFDPNARHGPRNSPPPSQ